MGVKILWYLTVLELVRRGLCRKENTGQTLRKHLGLKRVSA